MTKNITRKDFRLGIIGGMGTAASNYFQTVIVKNKNAKTDQENMPMVCITNPDIPDRTAYLLNPDKAQDPVPEMLQSIKDLEKLNVLYAVMPCNTAHAFRDELQKNTDIALLDMVKQTVSYLKEKSHHMPNISVGLLATTGTCETGIYEKKFNEQGMIIHRPDTHTQTTKVHAAIYGDSTQKGIKGNEFIKTADLLAQAIESMIKRNSVNTVILGCTELPLVRESLEEKFPKLLFIDPMEIVAEQAIDIHHQAMTMIKENKLPARPKDVLSLDTNSDYANYIVARALG